MVPVLLRSPLNRWLCSVRHVNALVRGIPQNTLNKHPHVEGMVAPVSVIPGKPMSTNKMSYSFSRNSISRLAGNSVCRAGVIIRTRREFPSEITSWLRAGSPVERGQANEGSVTGLDYRNVAERFTRPVNSVLHANTINLPG